MSNIAFKIMDEMQSERLWLQPRPDTCDYIQEVANHVLRSMKSFPVYKPQEPTDEIKQIDAEIAKLQIKRQHLTKSTPGEVFIHGVPSRRKSDGSVSFNMNIPGIISPPDYFNNMDIRHLGLWNYESIGKDNHSVRLSMKYSAGQTGEQKLRMALDFKQRSEDEENTKTNREIYPEDGRSY